MTLDDIEAALTEALKLRSPRRDPDGTARHHTERLEEHMLACAQINGALVEARHWLRLLEASLADEWEGMTGWEVALRKPRNRATKQEVHEAKIATAPTKYEAGRKARRLRESVDDQIERLEREEKVASRAYTMSTGG